MKRLMAMVVLIAMGGLVFAMGAKSPMTEAEAIALIDQKVATMQLTAEDGEAAKEALTVMIQARIQVRNAYSIVSDALDSGLRTQEMLRLSTQTRQRIQQGDSAKLCEEAAQEMIREQTQTQTQTQDRIKEGKSVETQSGPGAPSGSGK